MKRMLLTIKKHKQMLAFLIVMLLLILLVLIVSNRMITKIEKNTPEVGELITVNG